MKDAIGNTTYLHTVNLMRQDPYFYLNQAMQGYGLKKIDLFDIQKGNATNAIARIFEETTQLTGSNTINHYYTFGWSGLMSPSARYKDSKKLFHALIAELNTFWEQGIHPKVRLIGYSHGGNVCLNLAAIRQDKYPLTPLTIDELILLGVPIQTETDYLVTDQIFKKIYNIYSYTDRIQPIDFFSFNRFFSGRKFKSRRNFKVPPKVVQLQLKLVRSKKTKKYDKRKRHKLALNFDNPAIVSGTSHLLRNVSPGHIEFWFFGWTPRNYRQDFVLAPLPVLLILPYIIHEVQQVEGQLATPYPIIVDVRPEFEVMLIKQYRRNKFSKVIPFISQKDIKRFSEIALQTKPDEYSDDTYNKHISYAFEQAKKDFKKNKPKKGRVSRRSRRMRKKYKLDYVLN